MYMCSINVGTHKCSRAHTKYFGKRGGNKDLGRGSAYTRGQLSWNGQSSHIGAMENDSSPTSGDYG